MPLIFIDDLPIRLRSDVSNLFSPLHAFGRLPPGVASVGLRDIRNKQLLLPVDAEGNVVVVPGNRYSLVHIHGQRGPLARSPTEQPRGQAPPEAPKVALPESKAVVSVKVGDGQVESQRLSRRERIELEHENKKRQREQAAIDQPTPAAEERVLEARGKGDSVEQQRKSQPALTRGVVAESAALSIAEEVLSQGKDKSLRKRAEKQMPAPRADQSESPVARKSKPADVVSPPQVPQVSPKTTPKHAPVEVTAAVSDATSKKGNKQSQPPQANVPTRGMRNDNSDCEDRTPIAFTSVAATAPPQKASPKVRAVPQLSSSSSDSDNDGGVRRPAPVSPKPVPAAVSPVQKPVIPARKKVRPVVLTRGTSPSDNDSSSADDDIPLAKRARKTPTVTPTASQGTQRTDPAVSQKKPPRAAPVFSSSSDSD